MPRFVLGRPQSSIKRFKKNMLSQLINYTDNAKSDDGFVYIDIQQPPFKLGGLIEPKYNNGEYYRLDAANKEVYSNENRRLAACTSGGSVRFLTDTNKISVKITLRGACVGMHHFCDRGVYGIDIYVGTGTNRRYVGKMMQTFAEKPDFNVGTVDLPFGINEVQINLPLYSGIEKMEIGFPEDSKIGEPSKRTVGDIAFYGSSITQGGCVSRPANAYANIICRALDADCVNYGFSGSAMGELSVARHIATRDLACFVMDYDYNSPNAEHLERTHEPFFKLIREKHPDLPVVFVTHPFYSKPTEDDIERIMIVRQTYENAKQNGDENVYFVDSSKYFTPEMRDLYAVDNLHPNDLGHFSMAETIFPAVKKAISKK